MIVRQLLRKFEKRFISTLFKLFKNKICNDASRPHEHILPQKRTFVLFYFPEIETLSTIFDLEVVKRPYIVV